MSELLVKWEYTGKYGTVPGTHTMSIVRIENLESEIHDSWDEHEMRFVSAVPYGTGA